MTSVTTDQRLGVNASLAVKVPCTVASTSNLTLSGEQTIDGVTTSADRVLVTGQTDTTENGIYKSDTGAWVREPDWDGANDVIPGTIVRVVQGTSYSGYWAITTPSSGSITPGTTAVSLSQVDADGQLREDLASTTDTTKGFNLVSYPKHAGETTAGVTVVNPQYIYGNVLRYGAAGDGTTDDTTAIQAAIDASLQVNCTVYLPAGKYKTTAALTLHHGTLMYGDGHYDNPGDTGWRTQIYGVHTGSAVVLLKKNLRCVVKDLEIIGDSVTQPKTGIAVGRGSASSAGQHLFENLNIAGSYSEATVYSIASEENLWINCRMELASTSTGSYVFYTGQSDALAVATFTGSSNIVGRISNCTLNNGVDSATTAVIYMGCGSVTREWVIENSYLLPSNGYAIHMKLDEDGSDVKGPIIIDNVGCEVSGLGGGSGSLAGLYIQTGSTRVLYNLRVRDFRCRSSEATTRTVQTNGNVTLINFEYRAYPSSTDVSTNGLELYRVDHSSIIANEDVTLSNNSFGNYYKLLASNTLTVSGTDGGKVHESGSGWGFEGIDMREETAFSAMTTTGTRVNMFTPDTSGNMAGNSVEHFGFKASPRPRSANLDISTETTNPLGRVFNNTTAGSVITFTLPATATGLTYDFIRGNATYAMRLDPASTADKFRAGGAGKYLSMDSDGAYVKCSCIESGVWDILYSGTVSYEP